MNNDVMISLRLPRELVRWIDAVRGEKSRSAWIRDLIERERSGG